jgi:orotidine-5'-phosphate decarboxylase
VSVHYAVGKKGLSSAVDAAQDRTEIVVFLSSSNWSEDDYLTMHDAKPEDTVRRYAQIAADAGVRSVMCAAADAWVIKQDPDIRHLAVYGTGIRSTGDAGGEHKRIVTPEVALRNGVDYLVIGTPIVKTNDPYAALLRYGKEITLAQQQRAASSPKRR